MTKLEGIEEEYRQELAMNLLYTTVGNFQTLESRQNVAVWRSQYHIVELMPIERIKRYLLLDPASSLALVDAIVCAAHTDMIALDSDTHPFLTFPITRALMFADDIHNLPENCAMRDGRKWKSIPFVILYNPGSYEFKPEMQDDTRAHLMTHHHPWVTIRRIEDIVDKYQNRVLEDYKNLGIIIRFENGRAQIGPALKRKNPSVESEYYYAPADRRSHKGWITVKRDNDGLRYDVELFQCLLDRRATETEMHNFFEEHPAFLMQARLGIPISHRPNFNQPRDWKPDFAISPILGPLDNKTIELLELKGPCEKTLTRGDHRGFSAKVHAAVDQVRDYGKCLRNPNNFRVIEKSLGYIPNESRLAVLIGRAPTNEMDKDIFQNRKSELNVEIITYDEILKTQAGQIRGVRFEGISIN